MMYYKNKFTKPLFIFSFILLLASCGSSGTKVESDLGLDDAPDWVNEGSQALSNDEGRLIHGMGVASDIGDFSLQKNTADNRARAEVATVVGTFMESVSNDFTSHDGKNNTVDISRIIKTKTKILMSGVRIIARWKGEDSKRIYSLAELDLEQMKKTISSFNQFPNNFKIFMNDESDKLFDNYTRMGR